MWCYPRLPNDHVVFVDDASQGAVFNGKTIAYDYTGSTFKPVEKQHTHTKRETLTIQHSNVYPSSSTVKAVIYILWHQKQIQVVRPWKLKLSAFQVKFETVPTNEAGALISINFES